MTKHPNVDAAYALEGEEAIRELYHDWAESYDATFVEAEGYRLSHEVAKAFGTLGGQGPVLDVGAGTGVGGQVLSELGVGPIDALDLSPKMLDVAGRKSVYRGLIEADILKPLHIGPYKGVVSAGTFTFGHVGPAGLINLLDVAEPDALFVISVNAGHYLEEGFEDALAHNASRVELIDVPEVRIYDDRASAGHRHDTARLLQFRTR